MVYVIKNGFLIDGTGNEPIENAIIIIEKNKITKVGRKNEVTIPKNATILDAKNKTVMPGLIDSHTHLIEGHLSLTEPKAMWTLSAVKSARDTLEAGFTTARNLGGIGIIEDVCLKKLIEKEYIPGPRVFNGAMLKMTSSALGLHREVENPADGPVEVRKRTREFISLGADIIKVFASGGVLSRGGMFSRNYTLEEIEVAVDEAHAFNKKVASHASGPLGIENSVNAGVDSIEHGTYLEDHIVEKMVKDGTWWVPTTITTENMVSDDPKVRWHTNPELIKNAKDGQKAKAKSYRMALEAGVKIAAGTDATGRVVKHGDNAQELECMVKYGMTEMQAIIAATKSGGEILGIEKQLGTIEPEKLADIIIVKGNPLKDITILQDKNNIKIIIKNGKIQKNRGL